MCSSGIIGRCAAFFGSVDPRAARSSLCLLNLPHSLEIRHRLPAAPFPSRLCVLPLKSVLEYATIPPGWDACCGGPVMNRLIGG